MNNYQTKKLWEIANIKSWKRLAKWCKFSNTKSNYHYIRVTDFWDDWSIDITKIKYISEEIYKTISKYIITQDDLYISIAWTIWKTWIIPIELNGANLTENAVRLVYKDKNEILNKYVYHFTTSQSFIAQAWLATRAVAMPKLAISRLKEISIPLPPLSIQQKIVSKLDASFANLNNQIDLLKQNISNIEELNKSVLEKVFSKGEFEMRKLGEIFDVRDGTHDSPKFYDKGFPLVTSKNLIDNSVDLQNIKLISEEDYCSINKRSKVDRWDLLFAMIWTIGNPTIVDFEPDFAIKNVALFKKKSDCVTMEYLKFFLLSDKTVKKMLSEANWATQKFVWLGYLRNFLIPLPPLQTQKEIVSYLNQVFEKNKALKQGFEGQMQALEELKQSLLKDAFEGRLVQD